MRARSCSATGWSGCDPAVSKERQKRRAERESARKARDFARSDAIRQQLADAGILVDDTKDGSRWKRK